MKFLFFSCKTITGSQGACIPCLKISIRSRQLNSPACHGFSIIYIIQASMGFNFSDIFFVIAIFQLLLLGFYLLTLRNDNRFSNWLLGAFFISIGLNLLDFFLLLKSVYRPHPALAGWGNCLPMVFGPLLFLFTQSVLQRKSQFTAGKALHFLPFAIFFISVEIYWQIQGAAKQQEILLHMLSREMPPSVYWISGLIFLQFLAYMAASLGLIRRYRLQASELFSDPAKTNTAWLYSTIIFFTALMSFSMLSGYFSGTSFAKFYYLTFTLIILALIIFVNRVMLTAMRRPDFFSLLPKSLKPETAAPATKYGGSQLSMPEKKVILEQVLAFMVKNKPYLEPELTLDQLATRLTLRPRVFSQVINEGLQQNFFEFINRYRIEDAKRLLTNPADKKITVLEVLYEVGFNSKSSFNTLFKRHTGLTPSAFKKKFLQD